MFPDFQTMRDEITRLGFKELRTEAEAEAALGNAKGTAIVFVNSMCGCAGGIARPGVGLAVRNGVTADHLYTVFAGQEKEATARARAYFTGYPPSSPSIAVLKDGQVVGMVERRQIEGSSPEAVAARLAQLVEQAKA